MATEQPVSEENAEKIQMDSYTKDPEVGTDDPEVTFLPKSDDKKEKENDDMFSSPKIEFAGMTKEELMKFDKDPFWKKVRLILFILFWVLWIGMLVAVVVIIIVSPKCPYRPKLEFWEKDATYKIELKAFKGISAKKSETLKNGNFKGVESSLDYLKKLGFRNILLSPFHEIDSASKTLGDHKKIDAAYGTLDDLKSLLKSARKKEMKILMEADLTQTSAGHSWVKSKPKWYITKPNDDPGFHARDGKPGFFKLASSPEFFYGAPRSSQPSLNFGNSEVVNEMLASLRFWLDLGISGFCLQNVAFMAGNLNTSDKFSPKDTPPMKNNLRNWYKTDRESVQLFRSESYSFVKRVRKLLDEVSKKTDKPRALFVDVGNLGYEPSLEKIFEYYGFMDEKGADVVLNQRLAQFSATGKTSLAELVNITNVAVMAKKKVTAYQTAGSYLPRTTDLPLVAAALLLPGAPWLYYGQELGMATFVKDYNKAMSSLSVAAKQANYNKDNVDAYNSLPMQWERNSKNYGVLNDNTVALYWLNSTTSVSRMTDVKNNNYRTLSSYGHPASSLDVVKEVLTLRGANEAFQFGSITISENLPNSLLIFARTAKGFKSFVVVVNIDSNSYTKDLTFAASANSKEVKATVKYFYKGGSGKSRYKVGDSASLNKVYVPAGPALMVFQY